MPTMTAAAGAELTTDFGWPNLERSRQKEPPQW